jgi:steroid delta-isomerase-like uncharacterized protein
MGIREALTRYFDAWNAHDPDGVVAALTDDGTYEDPTTGGPLTGDALAANVAGLVAGFPDLHFDLVSVDATGDTTAAAQWRMLGTNTGPMPLGPATGGSVDLAGADFLDYDPAADRLNKVIGYFDTATMLGQLGLQSHITPTDMDFLRFGYAGRVDTQRSTTPGALTVTWIEIEPEDVPALQEATGKIIAEQLGNEGYLGTCFMSIGRRNYTLSAWHSVDYAESALARGAHAQAMQLARDGGIGQDAQGLTSIWSPVRLNDFMHPARGDAIRVSEMDGQWL